MSAIDPYDIVVNEDYPLSGNINGFFAYMLSTTETQAKKQLGFNNNHITVIAKCETTDFNPEDMRDRESAKQAFLDALKEVHSPADANHPEMLSCALVDMTSINPSEAYRAIGLILLLYEMWCRSECRVGIAVSHFDQEGRCPHIHFLYERKEGQHSEFQVWLLWNLDRLAVTDEDD